MPAGPSHLTCPRAFVPYTHPCAFAPYVPLKHTRLRALHTLIVMCLNCAPCVPYLQALLTRVQMLLILKTVLKGSKRKFKSKEAWSLNEQSFWVIFTWSLYTELSLLSIYISSSFSFSGINYFNECIPIIIVVIIIIIIINLFQFSLKNVQKEKAIGKITKTTKYL